MQVPVERNEKYNGAARKLKESLQFPEHYTTANVTTDEKSPSGIATRWNL